MLRPTTALRTDDSQIETASDLLTEADCRTEERLPTWPPGSQPANAMTMFEPARPCARRLRRAQPPLAAAQRHAAEFCAAICDRSSWTSWGCRPQRGRSRSRGIPSDGPVCDEGVHGEAASRGAGESTTMLGWSSATAPTPWTSGAGGGLQADALSVDEAESALLPAGVAVVFRAGGAGGQRLGGRQLAVNADEPHCLTRPLTVVVGTGGCSPRETGSRPRRRLSGLRS